MSAKPLGRGRWVALLVALGLTVAVLRYTVFLNLAAFRVELAQTLPSAKFSPANMATAFHHSGGVCLRFADVAALTDEEVGHVVDELAAARLTSTVGELVGLFGRWAEVEEQAHHRLDEQAEFLEQMERYAGRFDQLILSVDGRRMHDETYADAQAALHELDGVAAQAQERLDATQRAAIRPLWERHKLALTSFGLVRVRREIQRRTQPPRAAVR